MTIDDARICIIKYYIYKNDIFHILYSTNHKRWSTTLASLVEAYEMSHYLIQLEKVAGQKS